MTWSEAPGSCSAQASSAVVSAGQARGPPLLSAEQVGRCSDLHVRPSPVVLSPPLGLVADEWP